MEFGKQLAKYRKEHKIDQKDIADLLNVTTQTISTYETGKNKIHKDIFPVHHAHWIAEKFRQNNKIYGNILTPGRQNLVAGMLVQKKNISR